MKHTDENGWTWFVDCLENVPIECGIYLGPPDLSPLNLVDKMHKKLREELVNIGVYNAPTLVGRRKDVLAVLKKLKLPATLLRKLTHLYQMDYYNGE